MEVTYVDHLEEFAAHLRQELAMGLEAAAIEMESHVYEDLGRPSPPTSPRGQIPGMVTEAGRDSLGIQRVGAVSDPSGSVRYRVGYTSEGIHMVMHEKGINYPVAGFQQRKSLEPTVVAFANEIGNAFLSAGGSE